MNSATCQYSGCGLPAQLFCAVDQQTICISHRDAHHQLLGCHRIARLINGDFERIEVGRKGAPGDGHKGETGHCAQHVKRSFDRL